MSKKKKNGIFEAIRQVDENERRKLEAQKEKALEKHDRQREKYAEHLAEEKIELLKLKQGIIDKSEKLDLKPDEKKRYNLWQKFKNFVYHNKWWLGITSFFVLIAAFLIYDKLSATKSDIIFMLLCDDTEIYSEYDDMIKYFDSITEDYNNDEKKYSNILYIPISDNDDSNNIGLYESNLTRLSAEFQMGETMLVIADKKSDELVVPQENLVDLEKLYPDNPNVKGYAFYLKNTKFAERIGYTGSISDDMYIGLRKITKTLTSEKDMKKNYDFAADMLDKLIKDLSK